MVAMNVWPTDAADGSVASEARWRKMARAWTPPGVIPTGTVLAPSLAYPNLTVRAGACWVDGHFCELPGDQVLAVTANGLCVVRFDPAANTAQLLYLDGVSTPSQSPTGTWELPIAKITGSALSDMRPILIGEPLQFPSVAARALELPTPQRGQVTYRADGTKDEGPNYWTGANWRLPWNLPWGTMAYAVGAVDHPGFGSALAAVNGMVLSNVPCVGARLLKLSVRCTYQAISAVGNPDFKLFVDGADNGFLFRETGLGINAYHTMQSVSTIVPTAGTHTFQLMGAISGGGGMTILGASVCNGSMILEDIGLPGNVIP